MENNLENTSETQITTNESLSDLSGELYVCPRTAKNLDEYVKNFEGFLHNGIFIHATNAFMSYDDWYSDLLNKIPKLGKGYIELFIASGFHVDLFFVLLKRIEQGWQLNYIIKWLDYVKKVGAKTPLSYAEFTKANV